MFAIILILTHSHITNRFVLRLRKYDQNNSKERVTYVLEDINISSTVLFFTFVLAMCEPTHTWNTILFTSCFIFCHSCTERHTHSHRVRVGGEDLAVRRLEPPVWSGLWFLLSTFLPPLCCFYFIVVVFLSMPVGLNLAVGGKIRTHTLTPGTRMRFLCKILIAYYVLFKRNFTQL